ncbi:MAG: hypothetical protein K2X01_08250 [Cyanobacteria bacterium]|nr:hypothetical protein [Cyanobacteriota bacterium]
MRQVAAKLITSPLAQAMLYTTATRSVGSIFRLVDNWDKPNDTFHRLIQWEACIVSLATLSSGVVCLLLNPLMKHNLALKRYQSLISALISIPLLTLAEYATRQWIPRPSAVKDSHLNTTIPKTGFPQPRHLPAPTAGFINPSPFMQGGNIQKPFLSSPVLNQPAPNQYNPVPLSQPRWVPAVYPMPLNRYPG